MLKTTPLSPLSLYIFLSARPKEKRRQHARASSSSSSSFREKETEQSAKERQTERERERQSDDINKNKLSPSSFLFFLFCGESLSCVFPIIFSFFGSNFFFFFGLSFTPTEKKNARSYHTSLSNSLCQYESSYIYIYLIDASDGGGISGTVVATECIIGDFFFS